MGVRIWRGQLRLMAVVIAVVSTFAIAPGTAKAEPRTEELQFFLQTNVLRVAHGLVPLVLDPQMTDVARAWSAEMARTTLSHNPNLQAQIEDWRHLGENVGEGPTVSSIQDAFVGSPGHFANLVDPEYRNVGIGVVDSAGIIWVTVDFKTPDTGPAIPHLPEVIAAPKQPVAPPSQPSPAPAPDPAPKPEPAPAHNEVPVLPTTVESAAPTLTPFTPGAFTDVLGVATDPGRSAHRAALAASPGVDGDNVAVSAALAMVLLGGAGVLLAQQRRRHAFTPAFAHLGNASVVALPHRAAERARPLAGPTLVGAGRFGPTAFSSSPSRTPSVVVIRYDDGSTERHTLPKHAVSAEVRDVPPLTPPTRGGPSR